MKISVGIQLYTLRDNMAQDFEGTLAKVREMGYDGVEFAGLFGKSGKEAKALCEKYNLTPVSAHVSLAEMRGDVDATMQTYADIGLKYIVIPYLPEEDRPAKRDVEDLLKEFTALCEKAKQYGLTMLYHNHDFEFEKIGDEYFLDLLYRRISADLLMPEVDTCWVNVAGEEPAAYLRKYAGRTPVVHLKDFYKKGHAANMYELIGIQSNGTAEEEAFGFRPVGYGMQNVPSLVEAAIENGAAWVIVEQDRPANGQTPMESAKLSRDYLKSIGY